MTSGLADVAMGVLNGRPEPSEPSTLLAGIRNGAWLEAQDFPELNYHVASLIPEGMTLLVGPPKIGKSWMVLDVALAAASGGCALGSIPVDKRPVLYLALEDGHRRLQDRCRVLLAGEAIPAGFDYLTQVEPGRAIETIDAWLSVHEGEEALVFLDTLGKVMPPSLLGESSYQRDYRIGGELKSLTDKHLGSAIVINHHDRKANADDFVDAVSGTHGLAGAADTVLVLVRARTEAEGVIKVTGRDVQEGEYALSFFGGIWKTDGEDLSEAAKAARERRQAAGLGERATEVLEYVNAHPEGVSPAEVAESLSTLDAPLDNQTAGTYLGRLLKAGRVRKAKRGVYTPIESVESEELGGKEPSVFNTQTEAPRSSFNDSTVSTPLQRDPSLLSAEQIAETFNAEVVELREVVR